MLMIYNAFLHLKLKKINYIDVPYKSKIYTIRFRSVEIDKNKCKIEKVKGK